MRSSWAAAGDRPQQAIRYLELAGDHATDGFANDEAIAAFTEALTVATAEGDPDAGARLQAKLANVLWRTARLDETRAAFTEALRVASLLPQPDPVRTAHLYTRLGRLELVDRRVGFEPAAEALDAAAALLGDEPGDTAAEADQWLELMTSPPCPIEAKSRHRGPGAISRRYPDSGSPVPGPCLARR